MPLLHRTSAFASNDHRSAGNGCAVARAPVVSVVVRISLVLLNTIVFARLRCNVPEVIRLSICDEERLSINLRTDSGMLELMWVERGVERR